MTTLNKGLVGVFLYKLSNPEGKVLDESGSEAMAYLHGYGNIVSGLENAMEGKSIGDSFRVELTPKEGYGEFVDVEPVSVHRNQFGSEYFDSLQEGQPIPLQNSNGDRVFAYVLKKEGAYAKLTQNHPLAGQTLIFDIEIINIRAALPEELAHGHPHGPDGTQGHH